jgi:hypothetical protein
MPAKAAAHCDCSLPTLTTISQMNKDKRNAEIIKSEYKYSDLTAKIIRCAMNVHNELGNGFQEVIYQRALAIEFREAGIEFERELDMPSRTRSAANAAFKCGPLSDRGPRSQGRR